MSDKTKINKSYEVADRLIKEAKEMLKQAEHYAPLKYGRACCAIHVDAAITSLLTVKSELAVGDYIEKEGK